MFLIKHYLTPENTETDKTNKTKVVGQGEPLETT